MNNHVIVRPTLGQIHYFLSYRAGETRLSGKGEFADIRNHGRANI